MKLFETEDYFGRYEFSQPYMLAASDCDNVSIAELIRLGGGSMEEFSRLPLGYTTMEGNATLRSAISAQYRTVTPDQVLVLGAPIEGIYTVMRTLLAPGDRAVVLAPAYDALLNLPEDITGSVTRWDLQTVDGRWRLDLARLADLLPGARLLAINFPHNPTGYLPTQDELDQIVGLCRQHGVTLFSDEMYRGLEYPPATTLPSVADLDETAIVLSGASKSLGLPGLRLGWLIIKDRRRYRDIMNTKVYTSMCSPQASEYLGTMAIKAAPQLVAKNLAIIRENLRVAAPFFHKWREHLRWIPPQAGSVSVIEMRHGSADALCHELATKHGIVLLPSRFMGCQGEYFRLGLGRRDFRECLAVFDDVLTKHGPALLHRGP
ncbi:MAG: pyridoxal phosphate-dependent aminotransferase [Opitutaceae bacterium]|nr:pyridoxal phosphate-dependent aminotransferase [Opitutaceae bacterium]